MKTNAWLVNLDITPPFQKAEVSHKIKLQRTQLEARQTDHVGEVAAAVAPVEGNDRDAVPGARGVAIAPVGRQLIERDRTDARPFYEHRGGLDQVRIPSRR